MEEVEERSVGVNEGVRGGGRGRGREYRHVRDVREEAEGYVYDGRAGGEGRNLGDYFVGVLEGGRMGLGDGDGDVEREERDGERSGESNAEKGEEEGSIVCPVCGEFRGDERAVEWHVNAHFGDGE